MSDLANPNFLVALFLIVLVLAASGLVTLYLGLRKEKQREDDAVAKSEWQPTGKIDFHSAEMPKEDNTPAAFLLRVEEYRTVESISGVEHTEIRWRKATLAEAKSVLVVHQNATEAGTKSTRTPKLARA
jgi:hypothetical protein